jgi:hypothetical protein
LHVIFARLSFFILHVIFARLRVCLLFSDIDDIVQELAEPAVGFDEKNEAGGAKDINEAEIIGIKGGLSL